MRSRSTLDYSLKVESKRFADGLESERKRNQDRASGRGERIIYGQGRLPRSWLWSVYQELSVGHAWFEMPAEHLMLGR